MFATCQFVNKSFNNDVVCLTIHDLEHVRDINFNRDPVLSTTSRGVIQTLFQDAKICCSALQC